MWAEFVDSLYWSDITIGNWH